MTVTERFSMESADSLIYTFTVDYPTVWTVPFTGEYACHEANYAYQGIMKGARLLEADYRGEAPKGIVNPTRYLSGLMARSVVARHPHRHLGCWL